MMTDWSSGAETRNYRIPHRTDARNLADLLLSVLCVLVIAAALVGYLWMRSQIVSSGYKLQQLKETEETLIRIRGGLILEEETLKQPRRIDLIARNILAMAPLQPNQLITGFRAFAAGKPAALAMVNADRTRVQPRRPSANN